MQFLSQTEIEKLNRDRDTLASELASLEDEIVGIEEIQNDLLDVANKISRLIMYRPKINGHSWALDDVFSAIRGMQTVELHLRREAVDRKIAGPGVVYESA